MTISSAFSIASAGLYNASSNFAASAQRTVDGTGDLAVEAVAQINAKTEFDASVAVLKTSDDMTKQLLDILA